MDQPFETPPISRDKAPRTTIHHAPIQPRTTVHVALEIFRGLLRPVYARQSRLFDDWIVYLEEASADLTTEELHRVLQETKEVEALMERVLRFRAIHGDPYVPYRALHRSKPLNC